MAFFQKEFSIMARVNVMLARRIFADDDIAFQIAAEAHKISEGSPL